MAINIRHATISDANLLATIGAAAFADTFADENTPENMAAYLAEAFSLEQIASEIADPASQFLIAEIEGQPAGYAKLVRGKTPEAVNAANAIELERIYALKAWIGQGVGAALMKACLEEAQLKDHDAVWLGVWERNTRAIAFYEKWGFEKVATKIFQLGDDPQTDFVMVRKLEKSS